MPQYVISDSSFSARADLADPERGIIVEADGYEFHGSRDRFESDCRRTAELVARGWVVLRCSMRLVVQEPEWLAARAGELVAVRKSAGPGFAGVKNHKG